MTRITRIALAVSAVAVTLLASAAPAQAHEAPTPGKACAMSGMATVVHGKAYLCTSSTAGAKPAWSKGLTTSPSPLKMSDSWAKAAKSGMSAAFGTVTNPSSKAVTVIGAMSPYGTVLQLHEVVDKDGAMVMQQKTGGFTIPAGGSLTLAPGGNHIMFMKLTKPIKAGSIVPLTLITSDGGLLTVTVMGKVFTGANETYSGTSNGTSGM